MYHSILDVKVTVSLCNKVAVFYKKLGIDDFEQYGATTIKHVSFLPDGTILGSYGDRRDRDSKRQKIDNGNKQAVAIKKKRFNVMLPRQKLRRIIYEKLEKSVVKWGHKFVQYEVLASKKIRVTFEFTDPEKSRVIMLLNEHIAAMSICLLVRMEFGVKCANKQYRYRNILIHDIWALW